jgi:hypothetical protein
MFYTDIFIEVAVPFPRCRSGIPVRHAEFSCLAVYRRLVWCTSFTLVKIRGLFSLYFCSFALCVPVVLSLLVMLIPLPSGYGGPAGLVGGVDDPSV